MIEFKIFNYYVHIFMSKAKDKKGKHSGEILHNYIIENYKNGLWTNSPEEDLLCDFDCVIKDFESKIEALEKKLKKYE